MAKSTMSPSPDPRPRGDGDFNKGSGRKSRAKVHPQYPNTASFASQTIPDSRRGGRSKTKHSGF